MVLVEAIGSGSRLGIVVDRVSVRKQRRIRQNTASDLTV